MKNLDKSKVREYLLILILILITIVVRLQYTHQTDFDSYWIHGMAESINTYGYAKWVFHPASLFGYYPLSYPSGIMFFLAFVNEITGLGMDATIQITGIILGILGTLLVFILGRKTAGFFVGYLAAFIFTLSPQIIYYSSWVAAGRYLIIVFYLALVLILTHFLQRIGLGFDKDEESSKKNVFSWIATMKYIAASATIFVFMFMIHRTAQLSLIFIIAVAFTVIVFMASPLWIRFKKNSLFSKHFLDRYKKWNKWIVIDAIIIVTILLAIKLIDLALRGRLWINIERRMGLFNNLLDRVPALDHTILIAALVFSLLLIFGTWIAVKKLNKKIDKSFSGIYKGVKSRPNRYFYIVLLILAFSLFFAQFFGKSYYKPSLEEFRESDIFVGRNPAILFITFSVNYISSVTVFSPFAILGMVYLFLKKKKEPSDIFMIFLIIFFINILIDKRYVRMFITPVLALLAAYGISESLLYLSKTSLKKLTPLMMVLIILAGTVFAFTPQIREIATGKHSVFPYKHQYAAVGDYIQSLDCNCSTITTDELVAGVTIFAASGVPGGSHNIYYYVNKSFLRPEQVSFSDVVETIKGGRKLTGLWVLPDWIYGGEYYHGTVQRILNDYKEEYYIHDKALKAPEFYQSISPIFNKVYDNPLADVHHLKRGRVA
jgi:hypothetical protein